MILDIFNSARRTGRASDRCRANSRHAHCAVESRERFGYTGLVGRLFLQPEGEQIPRRRQDGSDPLIPFRRVRNYLCHLCLHLRAKIDILQQIDSSRSNSIIWQPPTPPNSERPLPMENRKVESVNDLVVWQKSHELVQQVYSLTAKFPKRELASLAESLRQAVLPLPIQIAQGFNKHGKRNKSISINKRSIASKRYGIGCFSPRISVS